MAVADQSLMEPRNPIGELGSSLRSQVREKNPRAPGGLRANALYVLWDGARFFGLVGDVRVAGCAVNKVDGGRGFGGYRDAVSYELS